MLVFNSCDGETNYIHLVVGPQTDLHFDMVGSIQLELSKILELYPNKELPFELVITRSDNELLTLMKLKSSGHPAVQSMDGNDDENESDDENETPNDIPNTIAKVLSTIKSKMADNASTNKESTEEPKQTKVKDPRGSFTDKYMCPLCGSKGVFLKENRAPMCADCIKIDAGLGNIKKQKIISDDKG